MMATKECGLCKEILPVADFHIRRKNGQELSQHACKACQRDDKRARRQANPEPVRASQRAWREKNRDKVNAEKREAYRQEFAADPAKFLARGRTYRAANADPMREYHRAYRRERVVNNKQFIDELKEATSCLDCGGKFPAVCMDFDHVPERGEKIKDISKIAHWGIDRLMEEIAKCDLVCANCHRIRTAHRAREKAAQKEMAA